MEYLLTGVYGGTFNPIHHGHLRMAQELAERLHFNEVKFIPSGTPPHKPIPMVSAPQRAEMISLAIANNPLFTLDRREIERTSTSYTIDTIKSLYQENTNHALCLMMGSDAFITFDTWHQWQDIIKYCHIVLVQRPNASNQDGLNKTLSDFMQMHYTEDWLTLTHSRNGCITMQPIPALDISSSQIRQLIHVQQSPQYLTPMPVVDYINKHRLYGKDN